MKVRMVGVLVFTTRRTICAVMRKCRNKKNYVPVWYRIIVVNIDEVNVCHICISYK